MRENAAFESELFDSSAHKTGRPPIRRTTEIDTTGGFEPTRIDNDNETKESSVGVGSYCRRFAKLMLSHLGTFLIVVVYVVLGGFLFEFLEKENEISSCLTKEQKYVAKRDSEVDTIYNMAQDSNSTLAKLAILDEVENFAKVIYALGHDPDMNCSTYGISQDNMVSWNLVNSAYFAVTIVTTIGYGHICPATQWGQIVCMIYSILGIPLMLLFLSKIGEPTAMIFRSFYLNVFCCKCYIKSTKIESNKCEGQTEWETENEAENGVCKKPPAKVTVIEDDEDADEEEEEEEIVNIPITVTVLLLMIYVLIGAGVFKIWESWTLVEATYFSFITLTTVGFGDYVPGRDGPFNDPAVIAELLVGCVYCLFGLAMLSMCMNLIQDEIAAKFHWIGLKLGLSQPEEEANGDDEDDEDEDDDDEEEDDDDEDEEEESSCDGASKRSSVRSSKKLVKFGESGA